MNAVGVRSVDDYHDASLDSLIGQRSSLVGGGSSHQRSGSHSYRPGSDFSNTSFIPPAPEVPRGPPISYPGSNGGNMNGPQRSFSQRAKGRPFAREAFANDDDEFDYDPRRGIPQPESYPGGPVQPVTNGRSRAAAPLQVNTTLPQQGTSKQTRSAPVRAIQPSREVRPASDYPQRDEPSRQPVYTQQEAYAPPSRSNTLQSPTYTSDANRHEWAPDRSPLQKLEVTLGDISKEEKRARVEEAEMMLRESKAGRGGRRASRDIATGAVPARVSTFRQPHVPAPVPAPKALPRDLEDAGLVRNLSTTQRDRIQHSTLVDTKKPDIRRLSGEGRRGFDYEQQAYHPRNEVPHAQPPASPQELRIPSVRHKPDRVSLSNDRQLSQDRTRNIDPDLQYEAPQNRRRSQDYAQNQKRGGAYPDNVRPEREVALIDSTRQSSVPVPGGQGVPSNITRAVSMQSQQPQPRFSEDRETITSAPAMKNANSSHKAALNAGALGGAAGAVALAGVGRSNSKKLQKQRPEGYVPKNNQQDAQYREPKAALPAAKQHLSPSTMYQNAGVDQPKRESSLKAPSQQTDVPRDSPQRQNEPASVGDIPRTPQDVAIDSATDTSPEAQTGRPRRQSVSFTKPFDARPKDEWKGAGVARLTLADMSFDAGASNSKDQAWWEQNGKQKRTSTSRSTDAQPDRIDDKRAKFDPPLYLRCGPLLRYTGTLGSSGTNDRPIDQTQGNIITTGNREVWRGSVMIVTQDSQSNYKEIPTLRLFSRPKRLLPPPPQELAGEELAPEYIDPIAGLTKLARNGQAIYVRPVDHLPEGKDLSRIENDDGLFEGSPSPLDTNEGNAPSAATTNKRTLDQDGESLGRFQEVHGSRLYADPNRDVTFWRFNLEVELNDTEQHIAYRINRGPAQGFWVPGRGQSMNIMFHSCNGFSMSVNPDLFSGPDPMWRDVLNNHEFSPFHVMIGGGDQVYNDRVMVETRHFGDWTRIKNAHHKHHAPFSSAMKEELEDFYLRRYSMWFSQGLFSMANAQIPMVNMWDDHDIIDGFGSYPDHFMQSPVFRGLGGIAHKYYLLFQHQSVPEETTADEPSWIIGKHPGPYIENVSRSVFMNFGSPIAFLGLDCRTERRRDEIIALDTYDDVFERLRKDVIEGQTKHLIVLLGVPIAYPRLVWLENVLTSRAMDPFKALGRAGFLKGGLLNKFDGGVEILDDLDDHWTASNHKDERNIFVKDLQDLAAEKSVRITILGGDVHLAAIGQFYSQPKLRIPKDRDHRYMPNVISSAIVNTPPPEMLADVLNKRNKVHHLDKYTEEDMIPMFTHDVDGKKRNNKTLLPRRNWCSIRQYNPGSTPPPTPPTSESGSESQIEDGPQQDRPPQGRRFSFTRDDVNPRNLFRRLSSRNAPPSSYRDTMANNPTGQRRPVSADGGRPQEVGTDYFGPSSLNSVPQRASSSSSHQPNLRGSSDTALLGPQTRPGFHRRPTNLSEKAAKKGNVMAIDKEGNEFDVNDHVNLEGGLDIVLNCEVNQNDPAGITAPYRLLVPALWYDGSSDREKLDDPEGVKGMQRKPTLLGRMGLGNQRNRNMAANEGKGTWGQESEESYSGSENQQDQPPKRRFSLFGSRRRKDDGLDDDEHMGQEDHGRAGANGTNQVNSLSRATENRQDERPPIERDIDQQEQQPKRRFGLFGSRKRNDDDYSDDEYTDEEEHQPAGANGTKQGNDVPRTTDLRQDTVPTVQRDMDQQEQQPKRRFGLFGSRRRKDNDYSDDSYTDDDEHDGDQVNGPLQGNNRATVPRHEAVQPGQRDMDRQEPPPKRRFGLFDSFRRRKQDDDYTDSEDYTDSDDEAQAKNQPPSTDHRQDVLLPGQKNGAALRAAEGVRPISQKGPSQGQRDLQSQGYSNGQQEPSKNRQMYIAGPPRSQQPVQQPRSAHHRTTSSPFQQDMQNVQQHYDSRRPQSSNPPPPQQEMPQRRLSKQERLLGINQDDYQQPRQMPLRGNGILGRGVDDSQQRPPQQYGMRQSSAPTAGPRGYDGIEAYSEPKARRRWSLSKGRKWIGDGRVQGVD
jgi:hypothetical protein